MKFGSAFSLGSLFGIEFRLHYTWFIVFILITASLSWQVFPLNYPAWPLALYWVVGIITSLLFFGSVVAHELAHSLVGRANGIPVKSITLFIFGGVSLMTREATRARDELLMAGAGPACSLVIGGLFGLLYLITRDVVAPLAAMAFWLAYVNLVLAAFNLIPGFPLDGGRVFRSLLWRVTGNYRRSTQVATRVGQGVGYLFILGGILIAFLQPFGLDWFSGLWLAFIGWFLENAASASYHQAQWRETLQGFSAAQVMTPDCPVISPHVTFGQLVGRYIFPGRHQCFLVADEGRLEGVLMLDVKSIPRQDLAVTQVRELMTPIDQLGLARPDQNALSVLDEMNERDLNQMPVVGEGGVMGLITRDSLLRLPRTRSGLRI
jgi:Zn-dependent protease/CBS domain-containing protein